MKKLDDIKEQKSRKEENEDILEFIRQSPKMNKNITVTQPINLSFAT